MSEEACARCGEVDEDRRTLWMACWYDMEELGIPFVKTDIPDQRTYYTLRVCKRCRADWMQAIKTWFGPVPPSESPGSGIYVRRLGANVEISEEEWKRLNPDREPIRWRTES